ncbi:hypothetical protein BS78_02G111000 [Paspalum vaginatum]|nr:hypothetical protein BS78_02G111000 [Paspalum vaginatum]
MMRKARNVSTPFVSIYIVRLIFLEKNIILLLWVSPQYHRRDEFRHFAIIKRYTHAKMPLSSPRLLQFSFLLPPATVPLPSMEAPQDAAAQDRDYKFIAKAVDEAYRAVERDGGYPFGAVIVRGDEEVVVSSRNLVRRDTDPSAHAEVTTIREKVVYGAKSEVAAANGFNGITPDAFVEYYQKSGTEIRQAEGEAARIADEVLVKTGKPRTK